MLLIPGTGNGEPGKGVWELVHSGNPYKNSKWRTKTHSRPQSPSRPLAGGAWAHDTKGSGDIRNSNFLIG